MTESKTIGSSGYSGELKNLWWLESGKEFDSTGCYYGYSLGDPVSKGATGVPLKDLSIIFTRLTIRNGLLVGVEEAWPENHLRPAIITLKDGLHSSVRVDHEVRNEIRLTKSAFGDGVTLRVPATGKPGAFFDLFLLRRQESEGGSATEKKPTVFISYSHKDEAYRERLCVSLQSLVFDGRIETWHDRMMLGGDDFENVIAANMKSADIILLLLSPDFIASAYCTNKEVPLALKLHKAGKSTCKAILLRHCDWREKPYSHLNLINIGEEPLCKAAHPDEAYQLIIDDIKAELKKRG